MRDINLSRKGVVKWPPILKRAWGQLAQATAAKMQGLRPQPANPAKPQEMVATDGRPHGAEARDLGRGRAKRARLRPRSKACSAAGNSGQLRGTTGTGTYS